MTIKSIEKVTETLAKLLQAYEELRNSAESQVQVAAKHADSDAETDLDDEAIEAEIEIEETVSSDIKAAVDGLLDNGDHSVEDLAILISHLTEALEQIDPDVFGMEDEADDEEEVAANYGFDDDEEELELDAEETFEPETQVAGKAGVLDLSMTRKKK